MKTKQDYWIYFNSIKKYVKLSNIAKDCGAHAPAISTFLKDDYHSDCLSLETLEDMYNRVQSIIQN